MRHQKGIVVFLFLSLCFQHSYAQHEPLKAVLLSHLCSEDNDHSVWAGDSFILFTSDRNSHFAGKNPEDGNYFEQIYISERSQNYFLKPRLKKLSLGRNHYGIAGQSDNPSVLLLYSGQNEGGEIFMLCRKEGKNQWKAQKLLFSQEMQNVRKTSAFLSEKTGELIVCGEIADDSYGGSDIYFLTLNEKGKWASPVNAGNILNSSGDEEGVFLYGDTLFFASTGHQSAGTFDLYFSVRNNGIWTDPVLLGEPFNSPQNDLYYTRYEQEIFFSSDRAGGSGGLDIYTVVLPAEMVEPEIAKTYFLSWDGASLDEKDSSPLGSKIIVLEVETGEILDSLFSNETDGSFHLNLECSKNYRLVFSSPGYEPFTEILMISQISKDSLLNKNVLLQKIPLIIQDTDEPVNAFSELISSIPDRIIYYQVQLGAFRFIQSISDFRKKFPALDAEDLMTETEGEIMKFLIKEKFLEKDNDCYDRVTTLQMKVVLEYGIADAFIVAYTEQGKRIAIIWSFAEKKYKILNADY